ncbi:uncharacterized mitochondrial protein AtMg00810-like [Cornus florida]|uniref:uncharacterized mitochondrial protein AtMg00810-like n=1 Tax=Cornus florida TaxID=4283 RepID=UPI00289C0E1B|nr:uncharacterized mitochondrial protein AtMg00810-like [Cornus florida]
MVVFGWCRWWQRAEFETWVKKGRERMKAEKMGLFWSLQNVSATGQTRIFLTETEILACKPVETPIEMNHKLGKSVDQVPTDKGRYQRLVGRLIYLSHTRPDITYAVSVLSQFMHALSEEHMNAVYRILKYLKSAPGRGLLFSKNGVHGIEGYTDSD